MKNMIATDVSALCALMVFGDTIDESLKFLLARRLDWMKAFLKSLRVTSSTPGGKHKVGGADTVQGVEIKNGSGSGIGRGGDEVLEDKARGCERGQPRVKLKTLCGRILAVVDCVRETICLIFHAFIFR